MFFKLVIVGSGILLVGVSFVLDVSPCSVCPFRIVVHGIHDFIMNWRGLFEKLVMIPRI